MRNTVFLIVLLFISSCSYKSPIRGFYKTTDGKITAFTVDSTLRLMSGSDTSLFTIDYNLHIRNIYYFEEDTIRIYNVIYDHALTRRGYGNFYCPFVFKNDSLYGGTLIATFFDNNKFNIGGYSFSRVTDKKESKKIFDIWIDLMTNNFDNKVLKLQK